MQRNKFMAGLLGGLAALTLPFKPIMASALGTGAPTEWNELINHPNSWGLGFPMKDGITKEVFQDLQRFLIEQNIEPQKLTLVVPNSVHPWVPYAQIVYTQEGKALLHEDYEFLMPKKVNWFGMVVDVEVNEEMKRDWPFFYIRIDPKVKSNVF